MEKAMSGGKDFKSRNYQSRWVDKAPGQNDYRPRWEEENPAKGKKKPSATIEENTEPKPAAQPQLYPMRTKPVPAAKKPAETLVVPAAEEIAPKTAPAAVCETPVVAEKPDVAETIYAYEPVSAAHIEDLRDRDDEELSADPDEADSDKQTLVEVSLRLPKKPAEKKIKKVKTIPVRKQEAAPAAEPAAEIDAQERLALANIAVVGTIAAAAIVLMLCMQRSHGFAQSENRDLATFPKLSVSALASGDFTNGLSKYFADTVPERESLKKAGNSLTELFGISGGAKINGPTGVVEHDKFDRQDEITSATIYTGTPKPTQKDPDQTKPADTDPTSSETTTSDTTSKTTPATTLDVGGNDEGKLENGIMIVGSGAQVRALEMYGGSFDKGKMYAGYVNKYKEQLGQYVNVFNMCVPTAMAYYLPEKYRDSYGNELDNINNIRSYLKNVVDVDAYDALLPHTEEAIYSRTDHHWQPTGAYYAAQEFAKTAQVDFPDLSTYEKVVEHDFVGTLYGFSGSAELKDNPEDFVYYKPDNEYKTYYYDQNFKNKYSSYLFFKAAQKINLYSSFLGSDEKIAEIDTDCTNGRVLVIFKDSFGNALVPFLTHSFSKIYVCDFRYFKVNAIDFCQNVGATDVLFAMCMFSNTSDKANHIENNRVQ
ncbi:MAG: DHHW family protein [Oscillospiraceae bacterium]